MLLFFIIAGKGRQRTPPLCRRFSTLVTFLGYYSARARIKAEKEKEKEKEASPFFSCRFMLFRRHNLPICLKLPERRTPGTVCRLSHARSPKTPRRSPSQASVRRCLQLTRLVTYCEIRCQAVNQRSRRRRKLHPLIWADGGEEWGGEGGGGSSGCESRESNTSALSNCFKNKRPLVNSFHLHNERTMAKKRKKMKKSSRKKNSCLGSHLKKNKKQKIICVQPTRLCRCCCLAL